MSQLLENTYNAYNRFLEGELNEYDLMSLIEDEIISGEVLESMLEEGFLGKAKSIGKKALIGAAAAGTLYTGANAYHQHLNDKEAYYNRIIPEIHKNITNAQIKIMNNNSLSQKHEKEFGKTVDELKTTTDKKKIDHLGLKALKHYSSMATNDYMNQNYEDELKQYKHGLNYNKKKAAENMSNRKYDIIHHLKNLKNIF